MTGPDDKSAIDGLLVRAMGVVGGPGPTPASSADEPCAPDHHPAEASGTDSGEVPRVTMMFCDLVGSTELSLRHEPELYRRIIRDYKALCRAVIEDRYDGHVVSIKGDGLLSLFGIPKAHGDDAERAVRAGLDIVHAVRALSTSTEAELGETLDVRIGVHRGQVYIDPAEDDVYGLAVNVASRLEGLALPGWVVISDDVRRVLGNLFDLEARPPQPVKGLVEPVQPFRVLGEQAGGLGRRGSSTAMVGRTAELGRLRDAWSAARDKTGSRPTGVLLRGDAGIGKTRLAGAIADAARSDGATVVELVGSSFHADAGFHPVRSLMEQRSAMHEESDGPGRLRRLTGDLTAMGLDADPLVPLLAPILGIEADAGYVAAASEARKLHEDVSDAAHQYLRSCLGAGPSVLVAEDAQWFDESTADLLQRLLRTGPGCVLVVITTRPDAPSVSGTEIIDLAPLSPQDCEALIDTLAPDALSADQRREVTLRSDGIPLYVEELVTSAATPSRAGGNGQPGHTDHGAHGGTGALGTPSGGATAGAVPDVLYDLLVARLYATTGGIPVATAAAAAGRQMHRDLLALAVDLDGYELNLALDDLVSTRVLERVGGVPGQFCFRHELLREVAYELLPPSRRLSVHSRLADAMVAHRSPDDVVDWQVVASHLERAGRGLEAAEAWEQAADEARRRGSLREARAHLTRAIELVTAAPDGPRRARREIDLRLSRGYMAAAIEGNASREAALDYERCLELANDQRAGEQIFRTLVALWGYYVIRADLRRARLVTESLRGQLEGERQFFGPFNAAGFGMLDWFEGDFGEARRRLEAAGLSAQATGHEQELLATWLLPNDPRASIHTHLALARFMAGDIAGADEQLERSAARTSAIEFPRGPFSAAYAMTFEAWMRIELGLFDEADAVLARMLELASLHGFDSWMMVAVSQQVTVSAVRAATDPGADPAALASHGAMVAGVVTTWLSLDTKVFLPYYMTVAGALCAAAGDRAGALEQYAAALDLAAETGMHFYDAEILRHRARLAADPGLVAEGLRGALELARTQQARIFELRAARDLLDVDAPGAQDALGAAVAGIPAGTTYPELDRARALLVAPA